MPHLRTAGTQGYVKVPRDLYDAYLSDSKYQVKQPKESASWAATAAKAVVLMGATAAAGYAISMGYEPLFKFGQTVGVSAKMQQCAEHLVNLGPNATSIGSGPSNILKIGAAIQNTTAFSSAYNLYDKATSFGRTLYDNKDWVVLGFNLYEYPAVGYAAIAFFGTLAASIVKPVVTGTVQMTADSVKAIVWPNDKTSTVRKVVKIAAVMSLVMAGIVAYGYWGGLQHAQNDCARVVITNAPTNGTLATFSLPNATAAAPTSYLGAITQMLGLAAKSNPAGTALVDPSKVVAYTKEQFTNELANQLTAKSLENAPAAPSSLAEAVPQAVFQKYEETKEAAKAANYGFAAFALARNYGLPLFGHAVNIGLGAMNFIAFRRR